MEFEEYIRDGGFPKSLYYDSYDEKITYTSSVINQIFDKDIKASNKIKDKALFERIEKFIINNFGAVISIKNIYNYLKNEAKINVDRRIVPKIFIYTGYATSKTRWYKSCKHCWFYLQQ